jgi:hypothetical protein
VRVAGRRRGGRGGRGGGFMTGAEGRQWAARGTPAFGSGFCVREFVPARGVAWAGVEPSTRTLVVVVVV